MSLFLINKYTMKILFYQFLIVILYIGVTSHIFVHSKYPDPIGIGFLQLILVMLHLVIVVIVYFVKPASEKKMTQKQLILSLTSIIIWYFLYLLFSKNIWDWLWNLRS